MLATSAAQELYARERLVGWLVEQGVEPAFAKSFVTERITSFTRTVPARDLLCNYADRIWPAAQLGDTAKHWEELGEALLSEVPTRYRWDKAIEKDQRDQAQRLSRIRGYL
jgi:hypothetical protein